MKITKNIISRDEAIQLCPVYVQWIEDSDWRVFTERVYPSFLDLRRGQSVITYVDGLYVRGKVTSLKRNCIQAVDGPVVRVGNGEYTWRVDGSKYAFPVSTKE